MACKRLERDTTVDLTTARAMPCSVSAGMMGDAFSEVEESRRLIKHPGS